MRVSSRTFYLMTLPALVLFFVFHTIPLIMGIFYSFTNYRGFGDWEFVGLNNYLALFKDEAVLNSYIFSFQFAIVGTIATNVIALLIAIGLNANVAFRNLLRGIFFVPYVLSILIVGFVFSYIFAFLLPSAGQWLGIARLSANILSDPGLAWVGVVVVAVWQAIAFAIVCTWPASRPFRRSSWRRPVWTAPGPGAASGTSRSRSSRRSSRSTWSWA